MAHRSSLCIGVLAFVAPLGSAAFPGSDPRPSAPSSVRSDDSEQSAHGDEFEYRYFDEAVRLVVDPTRVAVLRNNSDPTTIDERLRVLGIEPRSISSHSIPGWNVIELPDSVPSARRAIDTVLALGDASGSGFSSAVFLAEDGGEIIVTDEILVRFREGTTGMVARDLLSRTIDAEIVDEDWGGMERAYRLRSRARNGVEVLEQANRLAGLPEVRCAEPDMVVTGRADSIPSDPQFANSWGLHNTGQNGGVVDMDVDGPAAWGTTWGAPSVRVLVLDDGVQSDHPDLASVFGADFTHQGAEGQPVGPCAHHGTAVAGCIAARANNGIGTCGVAPSCRVYSASVYVPNSSCDGTWTTQYSWTVAALQWAEEHGVRVTNNSNSFSVPSSMIAEKYEATASSMIHFASAGNSGQPALSWPASLGVVQSVAALDRHGNRWVSSNYGLDLDFSAPGHEIYTTDRTSNAGYAMGDYVWRSGTSFAAPYAAGVAALVISTSPGLTPIEVVHVLRQSSVDLGSSGYSTDFGWGFVNAELAVALASVEIVTSVHSVNSSGAQDVNDHSGGFPNVTTPIAVSPDGRFVVFTSEADMLVGDDTNNRLDVFVHDKQSGVTELASRTSSGGVGDNGAAYNCVSITPDGRYVAFSSGSTNMVAGDTNATRDVFLRDLQNKTTIRLSVGTSGLEANDFSGRSGIGLADDGRLVAFDSEATNLTAATASSSRNVSRVFLRDVISATTELVSVSSEGQPADGECENISMSAFGRFVAFASAASNLVVGDTNGVRDVFVRDRTASITRRVSISTSGAEANSYSGDLSISADGRFVVFESEATNLAPPTSSLVGDLFVHDLWTGTTTAAAPALSGPSLSSWGRSPSISADGRWIAFHTDRALVPSDANGTDDVYLADRWVGSISRMSTGVGGSDSTGRSGSAALSRDGQHVAFASFANNLTTFDANGTRCDVFGRSTGVQVATSPISFGTPKINSAGCAAPITYSGTPSASDTDPFLVLASNLLNSTAGQLFYGLAPDSAPFLGGVRYVAAPIRRTAIQSAGASFPPGACSGSFAFDFNSLARSGTDPWLRPGTVVYGQYWYRDVSDPAGFGVGLTNALMFVIGP